MNYQSRWRSKPLWISVIALSIFITKTYFNYEIPQVDKLVDLLMLTLTLFGVFNNPSDPNRF